MRHLPLAVAIFLFATLTVLFGKGGSEYKAKDGTRVVILPIRKYESRLEFYSPQQELLCALDYSSEDHEHGFGVVRAAWTPDSNYFVFSLTSSGGHQSWHYPTHFYCTKNMKIYYLDEYVEASGISKGEFILRAPEVVSTEVLRKEEVPVKFHLDKLVAKGEGSSRAMICSNSKEFTPAH